MIMISIFYMITNNFFETIEKMFDDPQKLAQYLFDNNIDQHIYLISQDITNNNISSHFDEMIGDFHLKLQIILELFILFNKDINSIDKINKNCNLF